MTVVNLIYNSKHTFVKNLTDVKRRFMEKIDIDSMFE